MTDSERVFNPFDAERLQHLRIRNCAADLLASCQELRALIGKLIVATGVELPGTSEALQKADTTIKQALGE